MPQISLAHRSRSTFKTGRSLSRYVTLLRRQLPALRKQYHVHSLGVFGSYIHGTQKHDSDLDLLVEFTQEPSLFEFIELEDRLSVLLRVKVDLVMRNTLKPMIGRQILKEVVGL